MLALVLQYPACSYPSCTQSCGGQFAEPEHECDQEYEPSITITKAADLEDAVGKSVSIEGTAVNSELSSVAFVVGKDVFIEETARKNKDSSAVLVDDVPVYLVIVETRSESERTIRPVPPWSESEQNKKVLLGGTLEKTEKDEVWTSEGGKPIYFVQAPVVAFPE
jgi:hypothetical protein